MMTPGDIRRWEYGWLSSDILVVRVACDLSSGPVINALGAEHTVVELIPEQPIDDEGRTAVSVAMGFLERCGDVVRSNTSAGIPPRDGVGMLVKTVELSTLGWETMSILRLRWKEMGNCPHCGYRGDWVSLALRCVYHGIYI